MIRVKKGIERVLEQAVNRAYPVNEKCVIKKVNFGADYQTDLPKKVFDKYKTGIHTFGMFNEREIADGIFANCDKSEFIRAVQVSGIGDLQVFINENYICTVFNKIIKDQVIKIDKSGFNDLLLCHLIEDFREIETLAYFRTELLVKSLKKIIFEFGGVLGENRTIALNQKGSDCDTSKSKVQNLFKADIPLNVDKKIWIQELSSVFKQTLSFSSIFYLFNSHNSDKFLSNSPFPSIFSVHPYGSLFKSFSTGLDSDFMPLVNEFSKLSSEKLVQEPIFYYNLFKVPRTSCGLVSFTPPSKTLDSIWSVFTIYPQLTYSLPIDPLTHSDVQNNLRPILIHILTIPDTLSTCIQSCSMHHLISWIESLTELYIKTDSQLTPECKNKLNFLSKLALDYTFSLIHIDLPQIPLNKL